MKKLRISKELLIDLYLKKKLSTFQIADKLGYCQATIWKKLKQFGVKSRLPGPARVNISKGELNDLYINQKLSTWKIEKKIKIPRSTLHRKLKQLNMIRDRATAHIIYPKEDFSGNLIEKAYLIGFRLGDLGVRKIYPNSKTICVASGSTIKEQIELIESLFKKYGKIWMQKTKNGKTNIQINLNESFDFLLSKKFPKWIKKNKQYFFSFLAGFIDAEGHIGIYNKMARFSLGNYNKKLLFDIHNLLKRYRIYCNKPSSDTRKGKKNSQGYIYRKNYWTLRIHSKDNLLNFLNELSSYIKHLLKVKALNMAIENINNRNKFKKQKMKKTFQITTAIDYPSAKFHLGHAYEKICTDVFARWKRLIGYRVHFSTGTDCHGLKIERAAKKAGKKPEQFVNEMSRGFRELCRALNISYDDFIMTTEKRHEKIAINILKKLEQNGDVYKGEYEGLYCVDCETFYIDRDLENGRCPIHKKQCEKVKEPSYFFKISKYQKKIVDAIKNKDLVWPEKKKVEILNRLKEPLRDLSISREKVRWGIPLPFDKKMTIFVWVEALINYLTTIDYPNKKFNDFWPAVHIIGSDIVWHHTVIWYSILSSLGIELPKVVVHGFINLKGEKLSKSSGLTIDPIELSKKYSSDSLRYFLIRNIPFGDDGDFSEKALVERHNNELANKLGNLISRVSALAEKNGTEKSKSRESKLLKKLNKKQIEKYFNNFELDRALNEIFSFVDKCNEYIQDKKPWEDSCKNKKQILYELVESIREIAILLWPFIPESSEKIQEIFKTNKIKKAEILFKKIKIKK